MIAYNHYIRFIPELKSDKKVEGFFSDIVTVKENMNSNLNSKLLFELTFFNNQGRDLSLWTDREFARTQKDQFWAFEVKGIVTFFWHSGTLNLEYIKHENFTEALLEYWCLHIVLPVFFTLEETFDFLHAGSVEVEDKPILFIAESFGGKSTMTDFFLKKGHKVLSDDKVAIYEEDEQFFAVPSYSYHRPYRKMEDLGLFIEHFATHPKPIYAVYELERGDINENIVIRELKGTEKFISLRYASEMNVFFQKTKRFMFLTKMANIVHVYKVIVPWDLERLNEVHHHIIEHIKKLSEKTK